jgi:hypothetical protein
MRQYLERPALEETDPSKRMGRHGAVHSGRYDFDDDLVPIGASCFVWLVDQALSAA